MTARICTCEACDFLWLDGEPEYHAAGCPLGGDDPVRFLLDGLGVESLRELRRLVDLGRTVATTDPRASAP